MKTRNTNLYSSLISKIQHYRLDKLFVIFVLSLSVIACSDGGSSNGGDDCSDDFGDRSRCETRENL